MVSGCMCVVYPRSGCGVVTLYQPVLAPEAMSAEPKYGIQNDGTSPATVCPSRVNIRYVCPSAIGMSLCSQPSSPS